MYAQALKNKFVFTPYFTENLRTCHSSSKYIDWVKTNTEWQTVYDFFLGYFSKKRPPLLQKLTFFRETKNSLR